MKFALLSYANARNIGDSIQSLAVAQHVDQDHGFVERDFLNRYEGGPAVVVMNGWFSHEPQNWPPAPAIKPIFFGFHMAPETAPAYGRHAAYLKQHEPIGCRDRTTVEIIRSWGVEAYLSGCATMTFPRRTAEPKEPRLILVDQTRRHFPRPQRRGYVELEHLLDFYPSAATRLAMARDLLDFYRDEAGMVVTRRIHCAMPCAAMGIPVLYTGERDGRTEVIDWMGIPSVRTRRFPKTDLLNPAVRAVDFEDRKAEIAADLRSRLAAHGVKLAQWPPASARPADAGHPA